jgi:hypothetical protein
MIKKATLLFLSALLSLNLCGCVALLAGAAGGAGTAGWLSGKLSEEVNVPFDKALKATVSGLKSLKLEITKQTVKEDVAQVMGKYKDARTIWIDIRPVTASVSRIDVRVGITGDEEASREILAKIKKHL